MKKTLALLLVLVMAIGLFAGCAQSEQKETEAPSTTAPSKPAPPADGPVIADCTSCEEDDVEWTKWTATDSLPAEAGHFILQNDVTLTAECDWRNIGVLCLDLNGKTVTQTTTGQRIAFVRAAVVSIYDSSAEGTGKIRPCSAPETTPAAEVMKNWWTVGINISDNATVNMYGGTIDCSELCVGKYSGCFNCEEGSSVLNIYGGKLIGGYTVASGSGAATLGITKKGAVCNIYGGEIIGGTVNSEHTAGGGGTIRVTGTLYIHGGKIVGGTTNKEGGCIRIASGAEVYVVDGALITGGTADGEGDCIYVCKGGKLELGKNVELGVEIVGEVVDANNA